MRYHRHSRVPHTACAITGTAGPARTARLGPAVWLGIPIGGPRLARGVRQPRPACARQLQLRADTGEGRRRPDRGPYARTRRLEFAEPTPPRKDWRFTPVSHHPRVCRAVRQVPHLLRLPRRRRPRGVRGQVHRARLPLCAPRAHTRALSRPPSVDFSRALISHGTHLRTRAWTWLKGWRSLPAGLDFNEQTKVSAAPIGYNSDKVQCRGANERRRAYGRARPAASVAPRRPFCPSSRSSPSPSSPYCSSPLLRLLLLPLLLLPRRQVRAVPRTRGVAIAVGAESPCAESAGLALRQKMHSGGRAPCLPPPPPWTKRGSDISARPWE
jgi:hypothetical protein